MSQDHEHEYVVSLFSIITGQVYYLGHNTNAQSLSLDDAKRYYSKDSAQLMAVEVGGWVVEIN